MRQSLADDCTCYPGHTIFNMNATGPRDFKRLHSKGMKSLIEPYFVAQIKNQSYFIVREMCKNIIAFNKMYVIYITKLFSLKLG